MCVETARTLLSTNEPQREQRYYIASLITTPLDFNQIVRAHWGFENKAHWSLDVSFGKTSVPGRTSGGKLQYHYQNCHQHPKK